MSEIWPDTAVSDDALTKVIAELRMRLIGLAVVLAVSLVLVPLSSEAQQAGKGGQQWCE